MYAVSLCHDEISRRDATAIGRRLRRARFDQPSTLDEFDFAASPKLPAAAIRDLAALRWLDAGESVWAGLMVWRVAARRRRWATLRQPQIITSTAEVVWAGGS